MWDGQIFIWHETTQWFFNCHQLRRYCLTLCHFPVDVYLAVGALIYRDVCLARICAMPVDILSHRGAMMAALTALPLYLTPIRAHGPPLIGSELLIILCSCAWRAATTSTASSRCSWAHIGAHPTEIPPEMAGLLWFYSTIAVDDPRVLKSAHSMP